MFAASKTSTPVAAGPTSDPYFNYVTALLHGDGTNGGQNNTFLDSSTNNFTITRNGDTTQGTFGPFNGGNYSNYFDGSGDYLTLPDSSAWVIDSNYTIEFWFYANSFPGQYNNIICQRGGASSYWGVNYDTTLGWAFFWNNGAGETKISRNQNSPLNQWVHVAIVKVGTNGVIFLNGQQAGAIFTFPSISDVSSLLYIGAWYTPGDYVNGFISNLRLTKGTALYTSNFTPSALPLSTTSQTVLLTCASNRFEDLSGANNTITKNGDTAVQTFSPFVQSSSTPASYGVTFNGTTDYLNTTTAPNLTGDFTIECWVFQTAQNTFEMICGSGPNYWAIGATNNFETAIGASPAYPTFTSGSAFPLNQWVHVALCRSGTSLRAFINGTQIGSTVTNSNAFFPTGSFYIGQQGQANYYYYHGSISNFRIVKGTALYTANFTPSTTPLTAVANTFLLTCQNATFVDNSSNAYTVTANSNVRPIKGNPFGYTIAATTGYSVALNGGSGYFDGNGDYLTVPNSTAFTFGTGDFTVECWVYWNAATGSGFFGSGAAGGMDFAYDSGFLRIGRINTAWDSTFAFTPLINQWYHIAFTRSGSNTRAFVNGTQVGSTSTNTTNYSQNGGVSNIGVSNPADRYHNGYISNLRVLKGTALYTSAFAPSVSPLTSITNTQLLMLMSNASIIDNAEQNDFQTVGAAQISTSVKKYGTGSISFNGTNSYLKSPYTPSLSLGNGNFTIEAWVNVTAIPATYGPIAAFALTNAVNTADTGFFLTVSSSGKALCFVNSSANTYFAQSTATFTTGTWTHVAAVRNGNTLTIYFNGVASGTTDLAGITVTNSTSFVFYSGAKQNSGTFYYLNGYIDDLRITKGFARYLSNFTPPTAAFPNY